MNPKVDWYFRKADKWSSCLDRLRSIILDCGLSEELKWGVPCYTMDGRNIVLIHHFQAYCAVLFHKGALLTDPHGILVQQTENVQAARQIRFTSLQQIAEHEGVLKAYIMEAVEAEKAGLKVPMKKVAEFAVAEEFQQRLDRNPALRTAFEQLTPGRQRGYLLHFSQPKLSKTRESRVEKCAPMILEGRGLND